MSDTQAPTPDESGERVSDEIDALWIIEHPATYDSRAIKIARAFLRSRRSTDTRTEVLAEKPVTRPMIEFMAEQRENREAEVRAAALEEAAKEAEWFCKINFMTRAALLAGPIADRIRALSQPSREVRGETRRK